MDIIISISLYIIVAILLGFTFGWFIAKAIFKEKFEEHVAALGTNSNTNNQEKKINGLKEEIKSLKSKHEKEVDAFLEERIDITMKYKELLDKVSA